MDYSPSFLPTHTTTKTGKSISVTELENIEEVYDYDRVNFKDDRRRSLKWFYESSECSLVAREKGKIKGYAFIRKAVDGISFQPFYASTQQAYTAILEEVLKWFPGQKAQKKFIIPKHNTEIIEDLSKYYKFINYGPGVKNFGGLVNPLTTWMSSKEGFEFEENMIVSILDYHFGIV
ncbi:unnamed protein product [Oikopleura dioica]|uniref:YitH/HolE acetyltransferase (GNAT) domain-containing protein n=2 Tax=Oikopleura dioica TaxID=34765 RepID=E4XR93_OIKDI|nr:unnamed protein product [Oikopleura dioica]